MHIERNTGLKVSYEKTNIYRVGSLRDSDAELYTQKNFTWSSGDIYMLGVTIANNEHQSNVQLNQCIEKMENTANLWSACPLPLLRKILLINVLMGSLFTHKMAVLPLMSKQQIEQINGIITKFLWKGTKNKILLNILRWAKNQVVDFAIKQKTLHIKWVQKAISNPTFQYVCELFDGVIGTAIWECNLKDSDIRITSPDQNFWRDMRCLWAQIAFCEPCTADEVKNQIIWYNSHIKKGKKVFAVDEELYKAGLRRIKDILNDQDNFLRTEEFVQKYQVKNSWITF